jgi:hypothetical protein
MHSISILSGKWVNERYRKPDEASILGNPEKHTMLGTLHGNKSIKHNT